MIQCLMGSSVNDIIKVNEKKEITDREADVSEPAYERLTDKQRSFIDFYTNESRANGTDAARRAGYAVPRQEAYRLLQHADILACIRARARAVMSEYETIDHLGAFIRQGPSHPIERGPWVNAVEKMMKYHGLLVDKLEHSGTVQQQVQQIVVTYAAPTAQPAETLDHNSAALGEIAQEIRRRDKDNERDSNKDKEKD